MKKIDIIPHLGKKVRVTMGSGIQHVGMLFRLVGEIVSLSSPDMEHDLSIGHIESITDLPDQGDPRDFPPVVRLLTGDFVGLSNYAAHEQVSFRATLADVYIRVDECNSPAEIGRAVNELSVVFGNSLHLDWICVPPGELPKPTPATTIEDWAADVLAWAKRRGVTPAYLTFMINKSMNKSNGNGELH